MPDKNDPTPYGVISTEIDEWLVLHKGEDFDLDLICRQLNFVHSQSRKYASVKLSSEVKAGRLEKSKKTYSYIDNTLTYLNDWKDAAKGKNFPILWPFGVQDDSSFNLEGCVDIPERSIVVIAGVTNTGKSALLRNILWRNMTFRHWTYFTSETTKEDFADYAQRMDWAEPFDERGEPIFDLVERYDRYRDVIRPDDGNIIDWLNLGDSFYQIGAVIAGIKEKLRTGIAMIAVQKDPRKEMGMGGMWGEHMSSLYITLDYNRLTVKKAKKWHHSNPNGKSWGFEVVDRGAHFHNIRPLKKCGFCYEGKQRGQECNMCHGTGWVDG